MTRYHITLLNTLGLLGICSILLFAMGDQIIYGAMPCPLCLLQRFGFATVMFGFLLNVVFGTQQRHYGVILVGALIGGAAALRQIALHVIPGGQAYGPPVLGLHFYTWAFIVFVLTMVGVAALLLLWKDNWRDANYRMNNFGRAVCTLSIVTVASLVLLTFAECGPLQCPDNPVGYWLFG